MSEAASWMILGLDQRAAQGGAAGRVAVGVEAGEPEGQAQALGAALGVGFGGFDHPLLVHPRGLHALDGRAVEGQARLGRGQGLLHAGSALEILQQQGEGGMALLDRGGQFVDRAVGVGKLGDGAVEAGLAVGAEALVVGAKLDELLFGLALRQGADQHGGGADAHPQGEDGDQGGADHLLAGGQDVAAHLAARPDVQMPFRKELFQGPLQSPPARYAHARNPQRRYRGHMQ
jgi:hypothetical protein